MAVGDLALRTWLASPNTWSITQACCSKRLVGTVSGIQNFGGNVGGIIAPWLTGAIAHRTGSFAPAFVLCGFLLVGRHPRLLAADERQSGRRRR